MTERADDMEVALTALIRYFSPKRVVIGIENNKKKAIASMQALAAKLDAVEVKVLPSVYPQGGEKVLIYHTTGKVVPTGKLPIDVGCVVCNCTTIAAIGAYLKTGMPLVEKCVTVDGGSVSNPQNVIAPIGTPLEDVFAFCGGFTTEPQKVLYGGPMMGTTVPDLSVPIIKNTNAVVALTPKEAKLPKTTACIRCGACTNACPFGLAPAQILLAYKKKDTEMLNKLSVDTCMLCGCCSFSCPANRPLVQTNSLSKQLLREERAKDRRPGRSISNRRNPQATSLRSPSPALGTSSECDQSCRKRGYKRWGRWAEGALTPAMMRAQGGPPLHLKPSWPTGLLPGSSSCQALHCLLLADPSGLDSSFKSQL